MPVTVQDCFPPACMAARCFRPFARLDDADVGRRWRRVREAFYRVSEHKVFEYFILIIIFASSISLVRGDDDDGEREGERAREMGVVVGRTR